MVAAEGVAALEVTVGDKAKANRETFAQYLSVEALKLSPHLQVCHELVYDVRSNKINSAFPLVFLQQPLRVAKDELAPLSFVGDAP